MCGARSSNGTSSHLPIEESLTTLTLDSEVENSTNSVIKVIKSGRSYLYLDFQEDLAVLVEVPSSPSFDLIKGSAMLCIEIIGFDIMTCQPKSRHYRIWKAIDFLRNVCNQLEPRRRLVLRGFRPCFEFNQRGGRMIKTFEEQFTPCEWNDDEPVSFYDHKE